MFTNIGGKIKALAKVVCWIGIILSVIFGIISIVTGNEMSNSRYSSVDGSGMVTSGWTMLILGPLLSWVGSFVLYGFGELIDRTVSIDEKLSAGINREDKAMNESAFAQEEVVEKAEPEVVPDDLPKSPVIPDDLSKSSDIPEINLDDLPPALAELEKTYRSGVISRTTYLNQKAKILEAEKE